MKRTTRHLGALFLMVIAVFTAGAVNGAWALNGVVKDDHGLPVPGAMIRVYSNGKEIAATSSGSDGTFTVEAQVDALELVVLSDLVETEGADYVPFVMNVSSTDSVVASLLPASTMFLEGSIQFVDTENLPLKVLVTVLDESNQALELSGVPLEFGPGPDAAISRLGVTMDKIIVPAETYVRLRVNTSILVGANVKERSFNTELILTATQGGVTHLNLMRYSLTLNQRLTEASRSALSEALAEMTGYGFYITSQEAAYGTGSVLVDESLSLYSDGLYPESFDTLKRGYLAFSHATEELKNMFSDARLSVYVLIGFLAVASLTGGFLVADDKLRQLAVDVALFCLTLVVLYGTYPGSKIIDPVSFAEAAVASFTGFLALGQVVPTFLNVGSEDGRVNTRNLLIPIFNIAKRSLRRRKMRFVLTLTSITLLVMSFVTLTSFSEGYGLVESRYQTGRDWTGVFIQDGSWTETEPTFILLTAAEQAWLTELAGVTGISAKAESTPLQRAFLRLSGSPIMGVIGAGPSEFDVVALRATLSRGGLPGSGGVLISESLADRLGIELGDRITLGFIDLNVEGLFSDQALANLNDLDGTPYIPNKWVNTSPAGEPPTWVLEPCEPEETVIVSPETALHVPTVGVQRVALKLEAGVDPDALAERLALERGYLSYSSTEATYTMYKLGNYFEGRGLALAIPWAIVVLNVVVTMLNALYERRKEIELLSSVGRNPAQVSAIFVAEATITGFIAGGVGYLIGLGLYKGMATLNIGLQVHQKVSAIWSIASIGLAISAVLTGALAALRNSVAITPSLMRRWRVDRSKGGFQEPWKIDVPIKLKPEEVEPYLDFMYKKLTALKTHPTQITSSIKRMREEGPKKMSFVYKSAHATTGNFYTMNELFIRPQPNGEYTVELYSVGDHDWVHVAGSLVRRLTMDFSTVNAG